MKGGTRGFSSPVWSRHRSVWSAGSALVITVILCASGVALAATSAPAAAVAGDVNRTVPKVIPPSKELRFSVAPSDAEFLHTG